MCTWSARGLYQAASPPKMIAAPLAAIGRSHSYRSTAAPILAVGFYQREQLGGDGFGKAGLHAGGRMAFPCVGIAWPLTADPHAQSR
jgi:hypothetical protein